MMVNSTYEDHDSTFKTNNTGSPSFGTSTNSGSLQKRHSPRSSIFGKKKQIDHTDRLLLVSNDVPLEFFSETATDAATRSNADETDNGFADKEYTFGQNKSSGTDASTNGDNNNNHEFNNNDSSNQSDGESSDTGSVRETHFSPSSASLGKASLAVMVFYSVSGGPFGIESAVRSGGYMYTLIGFIVGPFIFSVQEALMTAELSCVFPEASGGMAWVEEAFGPMAGWMAGYLGWMAGATDNAIYPVLFLNYLVQVMGSAGGVVTMHPILRFLGLGITSICLSYINWLGLDIVGQMSITICIIAMSPFVLMTIIGLFKVDPSRWFELPDPAELQLLSNATDDDYLSGGFFPYAGLATTGILWRPFLNNLFWNLNSFDAAASFSADVGVYPERVIPAAMIYSVVMVSVGYIVPLAVAIGATSSEPYQWVDGYLAVIAGEIAGPWLEGWTILAAGISNIAMFQAELSADAFQLMGMADRGHVPKIFSHRSRYGTPTYGIILGTIVIVGMGASGLDKLIEMLNFNYAIALLMEYTAFLYFRVKHPELPRPWKIPLNTIGCFVFLIPTYFFILFVLALSDFQSIIFSICANAFGILIYVWKQGHLAHIHWKSLFRPRLWYAQASVVDEEQQQQQREMDNDDDSNFEQEHHNHYRNGSDGIMMMPEVTDLDKLGNTHVDGISA